MTPDAKTPIPTRAIISRAPFPLLLVDQHNQLIDANNAAKGLIDQFGLRIGDLIEDTAWTEQLDLARQHQMCRWDLKSDAGGYRCFLTGFEQHVLIYAYQRSLEHALTQAFDQDPHPLLRTQYDGTLVYANPASRHILETWQLNLGDTVTAFIDLGESDELNPYIELSVGLRTYLAHPVRVTGHDAIFVYFNDVTQTKALNKFPEQNPNPVLKVNTQGIITYANSASGDILTRWKTEIGASVPDVVRRALPRDEQAKELTTTFGDRIYQLNLVYVPVLDSINIYATDMTAFYELEEARASLIRKEKLAALGSMVAGVAHELNTPIGVTLTASEMLSESTKTLIKSFEAGALTQADFLSSMNELTEISELIFMNARKAADLIQSFKGVAVDHARVGVRELELKSYLERIVTSLSPYLSKQNISVNVEGPELITTVHAGPLSQVITNLLQNTALHAYQGRGGQVTLKIHGESRGKLKISIMDSGVGIAPDTLSRIFEPLFTTKLGQGGSGLGLHICYTTVRDVLKGTIDVESELGEGTTFNLSLPVGEDVKLVPE